MFSGQFRIERDGLRQRLFRARVVVREHEELGFSGRFGAGLPAINDGSLLFLQHMISKMKPTPDKGGEGSKIAIIFNGSPLFSGDAGSGPSNIRRWIIENDWLGSALAIILLHDAKYIGTQIEMNRRGAILAGLNTTVVGNLWMVCPPLDEQPRITEWCEAFARKADNLLASINRSIKRAQEYRSALITAAVTGQIEGLR